MNQHLPDKFMPYTTRVERFQKNRFVTVLSNVPMNFWAPLSLVFALFGMFILPIIGAIAGIIFGHLSQWHIMKHGSSGLWLTYAGLALSYLQLVIWLVIGALVLFSATVLYIMNL